MEELADRLDRERRLLEFVLFKLVEVRQLLAADETRFLTWASAELERSVSAVREAALLRSIAAERAARHAGIPSGGLTLRRLAEAGGQPWTTILADHADALDALLDEVRVEAGIVVERAGRQHRGVSSVLDILGEFDLTAAP